MRPQRASALAATTAISTLSNDDDDALPSGSAPAPASADATAAPPKPKRVKAGSAVSVVKGSITIDNPAPIDMLPYEIRQMIINYLEDDFYALLNLPLVSKVWYVTLMHGKQAEEAWHKRCLRMAPDLKRKKAGLKTWHANFIKMLHSTCICCLRCATSPEDIVGILLLYGFTFIRLCGLCVPQESSFLNYVTIPQAKEIYGEGSPKLLEEVPRFYVTKRGQAANVDDEIYLLEAAVKQAKFRREKEDAIFKALTESCPSALAASFESAIAHFREDKHPHCNALDDAVKILRHANQVEIMHYDNIVTVYDTMIAVLKARDVFFFNEEEINEASARPKLTFTARRNSEPLDVAWIDGIVMKQVDLKEYLHAVLEQKKREEEAAQKRRLQRTGDLRSLKACQKEDRETEDWADDWQYCTLGDCKSYAVGLCSQVCCSEHCTGPCLRHEKPYPTAFLSEIEEIKDAEELAQLAEAQQVTGLEGMETV